jgi:CubicO group peptidase (beta-lactamase class C family)
MHESVLEPLGMRSSTYEQPLPEALRQRTASGYNEGVKVPGGWRVYPEMAAAGLWTTAEDLAKYALAIERMNRGERGILSPGMVHTMLTPGMSRDGLGVFISEDGKRFSHGGSDDGFQSYLTAFIDGGAGVAILTNSDHGVRLANELMVTIARQYGWSGFPQTEKVVVRLSPQDLARILGHYKVDAGGAGEFDLVSQGRRILFKSSQAPQDELLAESPNKLFFREDASPVEVSTQNGSTAVTFGGELHAVKVR